MSTQPVSNSLFQELQSFYQNRTTDLKQLGSALQSGDLAQAQQVYSTLVSLGQNGPFGNSEPFANPAREKAFEALGQALQSGDLAGARSAFTKVQQAPSAASASGNLLTPAFVVTINTNQSQNANQAQPNNSNQDYFQQRKADLAQLGTALQTPNSDSLQAVQQAYDALVALGQNGPFKNGATFRREDRAQDFAAIGQALQAGDLAGAQQAFAALESTFHGHKQTLLGPPTPAPVPSAPPPQETLPPTLIQPPSTAGSGPSGPPEIIINVGGSPSTNGGPGEIVVNLQSSSTPEEVQINFGGNNGSHGQLTIDLNQQSNGNEQISINFNPGATKYQLVLNELRSNLSAAQNSSVSLQA